MYSGGGGVVVVVVVVVVSTEFTELKLKCCLTENHFFKNMVSFASKLVILTDYFYQSYVNDNHYHMEYGNIQGVQ